MKKAFATMLCMFLAITGVCAQADCKSQSVLTVKPAIYPYLLNPSEYPEDYRRMHKALTWDDFENKTQFVVARNLPKNKEEESDVLGKVYRSYLGTILMPDLEERLQYVGKRGFYIHNLGGYGPGSRVVNGGFGEMIVGNDQVKLFDKYLGRRFTGFDIGEQDGRFNFTYNFLIEPYKYDRVQQFLQCQPYFDRIGDDLKYWCSDLSVLWYWHYILKEGNSILSGAETQNKITNGQVQYMHLRGAGKQYGVLWYGDVSVFDTWGYKLYDPADNYQRATKGASLSLIKRSYYTQYMYNCTILSMETGWYEGEWGTVKGKLSPIGVMHTDCYNFVEKYGQPGVMTTQVALLNDFYSGWMPADHIANRFVVWNGMKYEQGDYLTDAVVSMIYPYYEKSGFFRNETGAISNTPYGENFDAILTDSRLETMMQYPIMVAVGDMFSGGKELADKITQYIKQGGTFVVTAKNAARLWTELGIGEQKVQVKSNDKLSTCFGDIFEKNDFEIYEAKLPSNSTILAMSGDKPVAVSIAMGKGKVILSLTDYGIVKEPGEYVEPPRWGEKGWDKFLKRPYSMMEHFRLILDKLFTSVELFTVGENLGYIVNRLDNGKYRIAVYNNSLTSQPFKVESKVGDIAQIEELSTGTKLFNEVGYWPNNIIGQTDGKDDAQNIFAGDIRLFDVTLKAENVTVIPSVKQQKPIENTLLTRNNILYTKEAIRRMPTFFDHFDGIAVDAQSLLGVEDVTLERYDKWFKLQSLNVVADLRPGFHAGRWSLNKNNSKYHQTIEDIKSVIEKLNKVNGDKVVLIDKSCGELPVELINDERVVYADKGRYKIVDNNSNDWESIYTSIKSGDADNQKHNTNLLVNRKTIAKNRNHILALDRYANSIVDEISKYDFFFDAFAGVSVPADYFASQSVDVLKREKHILDAAGVSVVVSFIEQINHFPDLTLCDAVEPYYEQSMAYYKAVIDKMGALGIRNAIFTTHTDIEAGYTKEQVSKAMRDTFGKLALYAQSKGVIISIANTRFRMESSTEQQKKMLADINQPNLRLTVNMNHLTDSQSRESIAKAGDMLDCVIIGAPANRHNAQYMSISKSQNSVDYINDLDAEVLRIIYIPVADATLIKQDCRYMKWIK